MTTVTGPKIVKTWDDPEGRVSVLCDEKKLIVQVAIRGSSVRELAPSGTLPEEGNIRDYYMETDQNVLIGYFNSHAPIVFTNDERILDVTFVKMPPISERFSEANARGNKIIYLMRHGEKGVGERGKFDLDVELTERGRKTAVALGRTIKELVPIEIHSSPISRCVSTSNALIQGAGADMKVVETAVLGDPGPFTENPELAGPIFLSKKLDEIAEMMVKKEDIPGMRSIQNGTRLFFDYIQKSKGERRIMVSHDFIICLISSFLFSNDQPGKFMPHFLEGIFIEYSNDSLILYHQDRKLELTWDELNRRLG